MEKQEDAHNYDKLYNAAQPNKNIYIYSYYLESWVSDSNGSMLLQDSVFCCRILWDLFFRHEAPIYKTSERKGVLSTSRLTLAKLNMS